MTMIQPSKLPDLEAAYRRYMAAELGSLNRTADELREAAIEAGWAPMDCPSGHPIKLLPWVREQLGVDA
jgi:hypothetical protein